MQCAATSAVGCVFGSRGAAGATGHAAYRTAAAGCCLRRRMPTCRSRAAGPTASIATAAGCRAGRARVREVSDYAFHRPHSPFASMGQGGVTQECHLYHPLHCCVPLRAACGEVPAFAIRVHTCTHLVGRNPYARLRHGLHARHVEVRYAHMLDQALRRALRQVQSSVDVPVVWECGQGGVRQGYWVQVTAAGALGRGL